MKKDPDEEILDNIFSPSASAVRTARATAVAFKILFRRVNRETTPDTEKCGRIPGAKHCEKHFNSREKQLGKPQRQL